MRELILTSAFSVCLLVFGFGAFDANASIDCQAPCQKLLLKPGPDSFPFTTGYRCSGFAEGEGFISECHCYEATGCDTFRQFFTGGGCSISATCACDGFDAHFNVLPTNFSCFHDDFAHHDHLFLLFFPAIAHKSIFDGGNTANLVCFPDAGCQSACQAC